MCPTNFAILHLFSFGPISIFFFISIETYSLTHRLFRIVFSFQVFGDLTFIFLILFCSLISLQSRNTVFMISILICVGICFMGQDIFCLVICSVGTWNEFVFCCCLGECSKNVAQILLVDFFYILDDFCPVVLSITDRGVLNYPTIIADLSFFASHILQFCCLVHTHLKSLCLLCRVTLYHYLMTLCIF